MSKIVRDVHPVVGTPYAEPEIWLHSIAPHDAINEAIDRAIGEVVFDDLQRMATAMVRSHVRQQLRREILRRYKLEMV